jgi:hypothetical protein
MPFNTKRRPFAAITAITTSLALALAAGTAFSGCKDAAKDVAKVPEKAAAKNAAEKADPIDNDTHREADHFPVKIEVEHGGDTRFTGDVFTAKINLTNPTEIGIDVEVTATLEGAGAVNANTKRRVLRLEPKKPTLALTFFAPEDDGTLMAPDNREAKLKFKVKVLLQKLFIHPRAEPTEEERRVASYEREIRLLPLPADGSLPKRENAKR